MAIEPRGEETKVALKRDVQRAEGRCNRSLCLRRGI